MCTGPSSIVGSHSPCRCAAVMWEIALPGGATASTARQRSANSVSCENERTPRNGRCSAGSASSSGLTPRARASRTVKMPPGRIGNTSADPLVTPGVGVGVPPPGSTDPESA